MFGKWKIAIAALLTLTVLNACAPKATPVSPTAVPIATATPMVEVTLPSVPSGKAELAARRYKIGVSAQLIAHDWSINAWNGMQDMAEAVGVDLIQLSAGQDPGKQLADIESLIQQKVDGIVILLAEKGVLEQGVKKALDAGIPVVFVDGGYEHPGVIQNISSDNYKIGVDAANWLVEQLNGKGNIILQTYPPLEATNLRTIGAKSVFEKYPDIKILEEQPILGPQWTADAQAHAEAMLKKYPGQIDAFGVCCDLLSAGAAPAIDAAGLADKILVTGTDGLDQVMEMIASKKSSYRLTFLQDSYSMGKQSIASLVKFLNAGGKVPQPEGQKIVEPVVYVPAIMITRDNIDQYWPKKK